jgi:hypothetical protein
LARVDPRWSAKVAPATFAQHDVVERRLPEQSMSQTRESSPALFVAIVGAILSLGLMVFAARHGTPRLLVIVMAGWVASPFLLAGIAYARSNRWPEPVRRALQRVMIAVAIGSVAVYALDSAHHLGGKPAAMFVLLPPVSWLLGLLVVGVAAVRTRTKRA